MCTMISQQIIINGSGKGSQGWFKIDLGSISYDHPYDIPLEYALNIDFVNRSAGPGARVAVELDVRSARELIEAIQSVLVKAEAGNFLPAE